MGNNTIKGEVDIRKVVNSGEIIELKGREWTLQGSEFWENN